MTKPIEIVRSLYDAFGRGDVGFILDRLADDVEWEYGVVSNEVPWYQNQHGSNGAAAFFASLAAVEFHVFKPTAFLADGDLVVVLLDSDYTVRATGARVVYEDAVMIWRLDAEGRVRRFAHRIDTHQAWWALHARSDVA